MPIVLRRMSSPCSLLVLLCVGVATPALFAHAAPQFKEAQAQASPPKQLRFEILAEQPHDSTAFTQGFAFHRGRFFESAGLYQQSRVFIYDANNRVQREQQLPAQVFAEGLSVVGEKVFVLTWREQKAFVFDANTLAPIQTFTYQGEGWGMTFDGRRLITSDGSDVLRFRDVSDFSIKAEITVRGGGRAWRNLNELEYAKGLVWANVWMSEHIIAIDPRSGEVKAVVDLSALVAAHAAAIPPSASSADNVLNGIAYDPADGSFWVTGKRWHKRYRLRLIWP